MPTPSSQASATASLAWDSRGHMCWAAPRHVSYPSCGAVPHGATNYSLLLLVAPNSYAGVHARSRRWPEEVRDPA